MFPHIPSAAFPGLAKSKMSRMQIPSLFSFCYLSLCFFWISTISREDIWWKKNAEFIICVIPFPEPPSTYCFIFYWP